MSDVSEANSLVTVGDKSEAFEIMSLIGTARDLAMMAGDAIVDIFELGVKDKGSDNSHQNEYDIAFVDKRSEAQQRDYYQSKANANGQKGGAEAKQRRASITKIVRQTSLRSLDPRTLADLVSNEIIVRSLRIHFPSVIIKSEEDEYDKEQEKDNSDEKEKDTDLSFIRQENLTISKEKVARNKELLDCDGKSIVIDAEIMKGLKAKKANNIVLWVDPLDGTKALMKGEKRAVTVLIGICDELTGRPFAGVCYRPFTKQCVLGIVGVGCLGYGEGYESASFKNMVGRQLQARMSGSADGLRRDIVVTKIHFRPEMNDYIERCRCGKTLSSGGAGNKALLIIEGEADAFLFPQFGTKKWDTAAIEAIIVSLKGQLTEPNGTLLSYHSRTDKENGKGFIATLFGEEYHNSFLFLKSHAKSVDQPPFQCPAELPSKELFALLLKCNDIVAKNGFLVTYEPKLVSMSVTSKEKGKEKAGGGRYFVCLAENLANKPKRKPDKVQKKNSDEEKEKQQKKMRQPFDPFAGPFVAGAHICDLTEKNKEENRYRLILNKFPVLHHHFLMVSAAMIQQNTLLNASEFAYALKVLQSLWMVKGITNAFLFFNSGKESGATQNHRHLHFIPNCEELPLNEMTVGEELSGDVRFLRFVEFGFLHGVLALDGVKEMYDGQWLCQSYLDLLAILKNECPFNGKGNDADGEFSYNMLISEKFMVLIPRQRGVYSDDRHDSVDKETRFSVNALVFAGFLFCSSQSQMRLCSNTEIQSIRTHCTFSSYK